MLRTPEQIEGIRESAKINTALLDHIAENIREGMPTEEIDRLVYDFTTAHGAIPAPLNYEGFPKASVPVSMMWYATEYPVRPNFCKAEI